MTLRVRNLQVEVEPAQRDAAAAWWAAALGGRPRATDGSASTHLDGVRAPIGVHVQRVLDGPARFHLDLETDGDVGAAVSRLRSLGASDVGALPGDEEGRILGDPAGLPFCVTAAGQAQQLDDDRTATYLHAVVLDVPAGLVAAVAGFWAAAFEGEVVPPHVTHPEFTAVRGPEGPGGRVGLLVQALEAGVPGVHVDLAVPDRATRDAEVARLVDRGATLAARGVWAVLHAPGGHAVCIVPQDA